LPVAPTAAQQPFSATGVRSAIASNQVRVA
jgi:hypothetical protein